MTRRGEPPEGCAAAGSPLRKDHPRSGGRRDLCAAGEPGGAPRRTKINNWPVWHLGEDDLCTGGVHEATPGRAKITKWPPGGRCPQRPKTSTDVVRARKVCRPCRRFGTWTTTSLPSPSAATASSPPTTSGAMLPARPRAGGWPACSRRPFWQAPSRTACRRNWPRCKRPFLLAAGTSWATPRCGCTACVRVPTGSRSASRCSADWPFDDPCDAGGWPTAFCAKLAW